MDRQDIRKPASALFHTLGGVNHNFAIGSCSDDSYGSDYSAWSSTSSEKDSGGLAPRNAQPQNADSAPYFEASSSGAPVSPASNTYLDSFPRYEDSSVAAPMRPTPVSLGWSHPEEYLPLYEFIMGTEPYFELLPSHWPSPRAPAKVFLDAAKTPVKGVLKCQFPGCSARHFHRAADLNRHYKNVHAPVAAKGYRCDYLRCKRAEAPFSRKDHFRDHLRDYHKEDLLNRVYSEVQETAWLAERSMRRNWWRCPKCLSRVVVKSDDYNCPTCKLPCHPKRVAARENLSAAEDLARAQDFQTLPNEIAVFY